MAKSKEQLEKETRVRLSKYSSEALLSKLENGTLRSLSEEVALGILEKRQQKEAENNSKGKGWSRNGTAKKESPQAVEEKEEEKEERGIEKVDSPDIDGPKEEPLEKPVKEEPLAKATPKAPKEKKKVASKTTEATPEITEIINGGGSKSDKIRKLHALGLSISEISKVEGLGAVYQQVRGVVKKLEA